MRNAIFERMNRFVVDKIKPSYSAVARQYEVDPWQ